MATVPRITPTAIPAFALEDRREGSVGATPNAEVGLLDRLELLELLELERLELLRELLELLEYVEDVMVAVTVFTV